MYCTQELAGVVCEPFSEDELPEVDDSMIIGTFVMYMCMLRYAKLDHLHLLY